MDHIRPRYVRHAVDTVFETIKESLASGQNVDLGDFGRFKVHRIRGWDTGQNELARGGFKKVMRPHNRVFYSHEGTKLSRDVKGK